MIYFSPQVVHRRNARLQGGFLCYDSHYAAQESSSATQVEAVRIWKEGFASSFHEVSINLKIYLDNYGSRLYEGCRRCPPHSPNSYV